MSKKKKPIKKKAVKKAAAKRKKKMVKRGAPENKSLATEAPPDIVDSGLQDGPGDETGIEDAAEQYDDTHETLNEMNEV